MGTNIDPRNQVFLDNTLLVLEELVEVDHGFSREVHIPHATRARLVVFSFGHGQVIPSPISIVEQPFGADDSLCAM
jgi:hypothetical protein